MTLAQFLRFCFFGFFYRKGENEQLLRHVTVYNFDIYIYQKHLHRRKWFNVRGRGHSSYAKRKGWKNHPCRQSRGWRELIGFCGLAHSHLFSVKWSKGRGKCSNTAEVESLPTANRLERNVITANTIPQRKRSPLFVCNKMTKNSTFSFFFLRINSTKQMFLWSWTCHAKEMCASMCNICRYYVFLN